MVLPDKGTPGTSREIYSEDADDETRTSFKKKTDGLRTCLGGRMHLQRKRKVVDDKIKALLGMLARHPWGRRNMLD